MALIREWVIAIISIIIFSTFIEILVPGSNYRRYINVVIGFLFIMVILTPLTKFINGQINFEEEILRTSDELELSIARNRIDNIQFSNKDAICVLYKDKVGKQIKNYTEDRTGHTVNEIDIEIEEDDDEEFGAIKGLNISLEEKTAEEKIKEEKITEEKTGGVKFSNKRIEPVQVNVSVDKKNNNTIEDDSIFINNEDDSLKDDISDLYNIPKDNINIYILKNN